MIRLGIVPTVETRIPASEPTSQKLNELLTHGVADGDARAELLKLAVRKIVEEALEAEVSEALGRGYYETGACAPRRARSSMACRRWRTAPSRSCRASARAWPVGRPNSSASRSRCTRAG